MKVAKDRLSEVADMLNENESFPPLLSTLQPSARVDLVDDSCMIDVNR